MHYNLSIELNEEQNDALTATVDEINSKGGSTTSERLLKENGINFVNERVAHYYSASLKRLGDAAASLPYADRKSLISQVESQLV